MNLKAKGEVNVIIEKLKVDEYNFTAPFFWVKIILTYFEFFYYCIYFQVYSPNFFHFKIFTRYSTKKKNNNNFTRYNLYNLSPF